MSIPDLYTSAITVQEKQAVDEKSSPAEHHREASNGHSNVKPTVHYTDSPIHDHTGGPSRANSFPFHHSRQPSYAETDDGEDEESSDRDPQSDDDDDDQLVPSEDDQQSKEDDQQVDNYLGFDENDATVGDTGTNDEPGVSSTTSTSHIDQSGTTRQSVRALISCRVSYDG